jgi:hypothetical protein
LVALTDKVVVENTIKDLCCFLFGELEEKIARVRAAMMARTERSVRENVGGGWGEIDRDV